MVTEKEPVKAEKLENGGLLKSLYGFGSVKIIKLKADDTSELFSAFDSDQVAVQVSGVFGPAGLIVEGTIDGENYLPLFDIEGNALKFAQPGLKTVRDACAHLRLRVEGGDDKTNLKVALLLTKRS